MVKQEHVLIQHLDELHTTPAGAMRIQRNLNLPDHDVIAWCKEQIMAKEAIIAKTERIGMSAAMTASLRFMRAVIQL